MKDLRNILKPKQKEILQDVGMLVLRIYFGGVMIAAHGWGKLVNFTDKMDKFPDPLGVGSTTSLALAVFAEVGAAALVLFGFLTRLSTIPLMITMLVAFFMVHGGDPFRNRELALVYLAGYIIILLTGPGKYSLDHLLFGPKVKEVAVEE